MASTSGIIANGSDRGEFTRNPILKDAAGYSAWSTKMETIIDADDCWDIVMGTELEPNELAEFKMKDLGEARFLHGIEIRRQENGDVLLV